MKIYPLTMKALLVLLFIGSLLTAEESAVPQLLFENQKLNLGAINLEINQASQNLQLHTSGVLMSLNEGLIRIEYPTKPPQVRVLRNKEFFLVREVNFRITNIGNTKIELLLIESKS